MPPLRTAICAAFAFCAVAAAVHAQEAAPAQNDAAAREHFAPIPDQTKVYKDPSLKAFGGSKSAPSAANNQLKPFAFLKGFGTRQFTTNPFNSSNYWAGNFKFKTTDANVSQHTLLSSLIKLFKTKSANVKTASAAGKTFIGHPPSTIVADTAHNVFRGKIQGKINREGPNAFTGSDPLHSDDGASVQSVTTGDGPHVIDYDGGLHQMTVEDVRELLDKTK